jgi:SAM-dependent MidA family methyltransferase
MNSPIDGSSDKVRALVRFDRFLEEALYGPEGFYTGGGGAGRRGDFLTSPEVGPLFGVVVARALDAEWERLGGPDPFTVVEVGAGRGALARSVLGARSACIAALRYICVERSAMLRRQVGEVAGVTVAEELPPGPITGVILANELLDNLAFRLLERLPGGWAEVFVRGVDGGGLGEILLDATPDDVATLAESLAPDANVGARLPLEQQATAWLGDALSRLERGRLVVMDYADTTPSLVRRPWRDWVRTYRGHGRGTAPWDEPGSQDVTCEVAVDQLAMVHVPDHDRSQAEWLRRHGIDELVTDARATWHERAHLGDLAALTARSRVREAEALCDPAGLGAFRVLEWLVS